MIKINLSPQRRPKTANKGQQSVAVAAAVLLALVGGLYVLSYMPLQKDIERLSASTRKISRENQEKQERLKKFDELKQIIEAAQKRRDVVLRLNQARAVPAHMLHELSRILTPRRLPTMTERMQRDVTQNPNRELSLDWDPSQVWIISFTEKDGVFRLEGGAQADSDMTQLALRMQASVYFFDVVPEGGAEASGRDGGNSYYKFTISGKVAY